MIPFDVKFEGLDQATMQAQFNGESATDRVPSAAGQPISDALNAFPAGSILTVAVRGYSAQDGTIAQLTIEAQRS